MDSIKSSVTFFLDNRRVKKDGTYPLKLNIYYAGDKKRYDVGVSLTGEDWEKVQKSNIRDERIRLVKRSLNVIREKAEMVLSMMDTFSFHEFETLFFEEKRVRQSADLADHFDEYIAALESKGRVGGADAYKTAKNSLLSFRAKLRITEVTTGFLEDYEAWMLKRGMSPSTIGIYLRHLRRIINLAINKGLFPAQKYPFKNYTVPASRNIKKALTFQELRKLLDYTPSTLDQQKALDFWLLSYMCNGMNMADICHLKTSNIQGSFLFFYRTKTKTTRKNDLRPLKVPLLDRSLKIIERWKTRESSSDYLFPILNEGLSPRQIKYKIQDFIWKVNKGMKSIASEIGIESNVSTYAARHSHATVLKRKGASMELIRENLGHSSLLVTERYLDDFTDEVKMENAKLLTDI